MECAARRRIPYERVPQRAGPLNGCNSRPWSAEIRVGTVVSGLAFVDTIRRDPGYGAVARQVPTRYLDILVPAATMPTPGVPGYAQTGVAAGAGRRGQCGIG